LGGFIFSPQPLVVVVTVAAVVRRHRGRSSLSPLIVASPSMPAFISFDLLFT
ncbi:hypothetical protein TorRG33x02_289000, partial [Trema orientale]